MSAGTSYTKRYGAGFVDLPTKTTPVDQQFLNAVETALLQLIGVAPTVDGQVAQWDNANTRFGPALLLNKNIDPSAAIAKSKLDLTGANGIVDADIAGAAAIAQSKISGLAASLAAAGAPSGSIIQYAAAAAPTGWALCDGSSQLRTDPTYSALFAVIGTTYGAADGTHFNLPDLQGRVAVGKGTNASVNALALNEGAALANRRGLFHRHTPHSHGPSSGTWLGFPGFNGDWTVLTAAANKADQLLSISATTSVDGGSGVATDPLDGGAFLVVNYIIKL